MLGLVGNRYSPSDRRPLAAGGDTRPGPSGGHTSAPEVRLPPLTRAGLLAGLLLAEVVALSLRFDMGALAGDGRWWAPLLLRASWLPQLALLVGAATVILAGGRLCRAWRAAGRPCQSFPWSFFAGHLLAIAGFAGLTASFLEGSARAAPFAEAWVAAWFGLGLIAAACWVACLTPPRSWRALAAQNWPVALAAGGIGLAAWLVGRLATGGWEAFGRCTLLTASGLLRLVSAQVICFPDQFILGTPSFLVEVSPACSGYEGMGLMAVFLGAYLWLFRRDLRFPHALALLPVGVALAWVLNAARIAALIAIGTWLSPAVARGGFHSQAGWLAFVSVALGLVAVSQRSTFLRLRGDRLVGPTRERGFAKDRPRARVGLIAGEASADPTPDPTVGYVGPLLVLVATQMIAAASCRSPELLYPVRVLTVAAALWFLRPSYAAALRGASAAGAVCGAAAFVLWLALEPIARGGDAAGTLPAEFGSLPAGYLVSWLFFRVLGSVVLVPVAEELAFRGYLLRRLQAADFQTVPPGRFTWLSFVVSSAVFGALHGRWLAGTLAGMIYALAVYRRGRLGDAILAHAVTNGLIAVTVLAFGAWGLWF